MKRKNLKAYVRLDKNGQPIGGSMIYRDKQPYGKFKPLLEPYGDVCCPPIPPAPTECFRDGVFSLITDNTGYYYATSGVRAVTDGNCNMYKLMWGGATPGENTTSMIEKYASDGTLTWRKVYAFSNDLGGISARPRGFEIGPDGSLYILDGLGFSKLTSDGVVLWSKLFNVGFSELFNDITVTSTGRVYVVKNEIQSGPIYPTAIYEIDPADGSFLNSTSITFSLPGIITEADLWAGYTITKDNNDNILCTINGYTNGAYYPAYDNFISGMFKMDPDLNILWFKLFDAGNSGYTTYADSSVTNISFDKDNNILVSQGYSSSIIKLSPDGDVVLWQRLMGTPASPDAGNNGRMANVAVDDQGNVFIVGNLQNAPITYGNPNPATAIVKWDSNGVFQFATGVYLTSFFNYELYPNGPVKYIFYKNSTLYIQFANNYAPTFKVPTTTPIIANNYPALPTGEDTVFFDALSYLQIGSWDYVTKNATPTVYTSNVLPPVTHTVTETPVSRPILLTPLLY